MAEYDPEKTDENGDRLRVVVDRLKAENAALRSRVEELKKAARGAVDNAGIASDWVLISPYDFKRLRTVLGERVEVEEGQKKVEHLKQVPRATGDTEDRWKP